MAALGGLLAVVVCLGVSTVAAAVVAFPVVIVWHVWVKASRAHERERRDAWLRIEGG